MQPDASAGMPDQGSGGGGEDDLALPPSPDLAPIVFGSGGSWSFDEGKGKSAGGAALHGAPAWTVGKVSTALQLDGQADSVEAGAALIDNTKSFSLGGWVRLDRLDRAATIIGLDGSTVSAVQLGYWPAAGSTPATFGLAIAAEDKDGGAFARVVAPFAPVADVWYHVAATYDADAKTARLYVDGLKVSEGPVPATFAAAGATALGRGRAGGQPAQFWPGVLDELHLAAGVWSDSDVATLYGAAATVTPVRPPSVPLIVRSPYVSTWTPNEKAAGTWPTFWTGAVKAITGMLRVDGKVYLFMGAPGGVTSQAQQLALEITATQSRYVFGAGGVRLYLDFLSPVESNDIKSLSMPFGIVRAQAVSVDGQTHDTSIYFDISGEWAHGDPAQQIGWSRVDVGGSSLPVTAFAVTPSAPTVLGEANDYASWGTAVFATATPGAQNQAGADVDVRALFTGGGTLANTVDSNQPRAINNSWPVFAFQANLGALGGTPSTPRLYALGNIRQPATSFKGTQQAPLWQSYWASWQAMLADALKDADSGAMFARADAVDKRVAVDAVAAGGAHYGALCALALRQAFGGVEMVQNGPNDPWLYLKEISSDGNMQTVDVIYPSMPAFLYLNPMLLRYLITPILVYSESGKWPQPFAPHDLGSSYPNATGHDDGGGENMPVEESANMVIMAAAYLQAANNADAKAFISSHYAVLKTWADYLVANALDPGLQNQTDDFTGFIAHSSNLALKGIVGIGAMAQIATALGNSADATHYLTTAKDYITQWNTKSQDATATHLKLAYDQPDDTWSLKYNSYPDRLLHLNLIPASALAEETAWYLKQKNEYGFPLDNRHTYTKADWELWTAAGVSDPGLRQALVDTVYHFADKTPQRVPFTDWYDTLAGTQSGFQARPVMGGLFSLMTLTP